MVKAGSAYPLSKTDMLSAGQQAAHGPLYKNSRIVVPNHARHLRATSLGVSTRTVRVPISLYGLICALQTI